MKTINLTLLVILLFATSLQATDWRNEGRHLRLVNDLDRPEDGYCLDVVGSGPNIRTDLPLIAHNCKPGLYADEAIVFQSDGRILFPAFGGCVTVAGLNSRALPGAALMLKGCGENTPFLNTAGLQNFRLREDARIELEETGLCLMVGDESDSTFSEDHRWRTLYVDACAKAQADRSQWRVSKPKPVAGPKF